MGTTISFSNIGQGMSYFASGICDSEGDYAWSSGKSAELAILLGNSINNDLLAEIDLHYVFANQQYVIISSGEAVLYDVIVTPAQGKPIAFIIPNRCIQKWMAESQIRISGHFAC